MENEELIFELKDRLLKWLFRRDLKPDKIIAKQILNLISKKIIIFEVISEINQRYEYRVTKLHNGDIKIIPAEKGR